MHTQKPTNKALYFVAYGNAIHIGETEVGQITTSGQPNFRPAEDEADLLGKTADIDLTGYKELPEAGEQVDTGIYSYGDSMVICRQAHVRTEHNPKDVPALFSFYRASPEGLEWMPMEKVAIGETRLYNEVLYEVIQAHTTQEGWEPDKTEALWQVKEESGGDIPDWVQPTGGHDAYSIGDEVMFEGTHYRSLIDGNSWSPTVYPAGWEII